MDNYELKQQQKHMIRFKDDITKKENWNWVKDRKSFPPDQIKLFRDSCINISDLIVLYGTESGSDRECLHL